MRRQEESLSLNEITRREKAIGPFAVAHQYSDEGPRTLMVLDGDGQMQLEGIDPQHIDALEVIIAAANQGIEKVEPDT